MDCMLTWLGQGGFEIEMGGARAVIDPYLSDLVEKMEGHRRLVPAPLAPKDLAGALVITTHDHIDHFDTDTLSAADPAASTFAGPDSCAAHFRAIGVADERVLPFDRGGSIAWGPMTLRAVYAEHTGDSIGVVLEADGLRCYFTGDTLGSPKLREAGAGCDMLITCVNGRWGNMGHEEAARLARDLGVRCAVPVHYGMFAANTADPMDFVKALEGSGIRVSLLTHGVKARLRDVFEGGL